MTHYIKRKNAVIEPKGKGWGKKGRKGGTAGNSATAVKTATKRSRYDFWNETGF